MMAVIVAPFLHPAMFKFNPNLLNATHREADRRISQL
jgi:hypothetical protein